MIITLTFKVSCARIIVDDKILIAPPLAAIAASLPPISLSVSDQEGPFHESPFLEAGPLKRDESYSERIEDWVRAFVPPKVTLDNSFPSILIGRPSRVFTKIEA